MTEIILSSSEFNSFIDARKGKIVGQAKKVTKNEREYSSYTVLCPLPILAGIVKIIKALAITVFSLGFALFSKNVSTLWTEMLKDRLTVLTYNTLLELPADIRKMITGYLDIKAVGYLALSCTQFNKTLVIEDEIFFDKICVNLKQKKYIYILTMINNLLSFLLIL